MRTFPSSFMCTFFVPAKSLKLASLGWKHFILVEGTNKS